MNSVQFASWVNDALTNNGGSPRFNEAYMDRLITWQNAKPYAPGQRMTADGTIVYPIEAQASGQWYGGFSTGVPAPGVINEDFRIDAEDLVQQFLVVVLSRCSNGAPGHVAHGI